MKIISCNLNGIRASARKGFLAWAADQAADFVCVQETKAQMAQLDQAAFALPGMTMAFADAQKKGYSGVGIYAKKAPQSIITEAISPRAVDEGRFIAFEYPELTVVSLYLPSGTSGEQRQAVKMQLLADFYNGLLSDSLWLNKPVVIAGDWNIAHKAIDLKNWRQNQKSSGFLPEERAWMDSVIDGLGWVDAFRHVHPEQPDHYTWWSYRAGARARNVGWRIDYQLLSPSLASQVKAAWIETESIFSDHAPLIVELADVSL